VQGDVRPSRSTSSETRSPTSTSTIFKDDEGSNRVVDDERDHPLDLDLRTADIALQTAEWPLNSATAKTPQQRADDAADRVHAKVASASSSRTFA